MAEMNSQPVEIEGPFDQNNADHQAALESGQEVVSLPKGADVIPFPGSKIENSAGPDVSTQSLEVIMERANDARAFSKARQEEQREQRRPSVRARKAVDNISTKAKTGAAVGAGVVVLGLAGAEDMREAQRQAALGEKLEQRATPPAAETADGADTIRTYRDASGAEITEVTDPSSGEAQIIVTPAPTEISPVADPSPTAETPTPQPAATDSTGGAEYASPNTAGGAEYDPTSTNRIEPFPTAEADPGTGGAIAPDETSNGGAVTPEEK